MTEHQPTTRALLSAMMHSVQPMVLTDPHLADHPMIAVNPAFESLTGYSAGETVGRNCRFLQGEGTDVDTTRRIRRCLAERRGCIEWVVNYRRDGARFWNLLFISPVFAADGTLLHFFGNQRDLTNALPEGPPEHTLGGADMPAAGVAEFNALLLDVLALPEAGRTAGLEGIVEAARRLDSVTTRLEAAPWRP